MTTVEPAAGRRCINCSNTRPDSASIRRPHPDVRVKSSDSRGVAHTHLARGQAVYQVVKRQKLLSVHKRKLVSKKENCSYRSNGWQTCHSGCNELCGHPSGPDANLLTVFECRVEVSLSFEGLNLRKMIAVDVRVHSKEAREYFLARRLEVPRERRVG